MKTVESVTPGHPDKICDQIADAILDAYLTHDPRSRVAVEVFGSHGALMIGGEVTSTADIDVVQIATKVYHDIGYKDDLEVFTNIEEQSIDIAKNVDSGGASDQGVVYGYATIETPEYLPKPVVLVHKLAFMLHDLRRYNSQFAWLGPDGKTQITIDNSGLVASVLISTQHQEDVSPMDVQKMLLSHLIEPVLGDLSHVKIFVNPGGKFTNGGFSVDTGVSGHKIMVDTYGGLIPHGGGSFSGKDPSKIDRSAAYFARFAAKNIVAQGLAKNCFVSVAYAIGKEDPVMLEAKSGDGKDLTDYLKQNFDFRPRAILERLNLRQPIYQKNAVFGHFGRDDSPWEIITL